MDDLSGRDIPLHLLFRFNGRLVHVVVLYERSGNYLWHGPLRLQGNMDHTFAPFRDLEFGRYAGAYNRYSVFGPDYMYGSVPNRNLTGKLKEKWCNNKAIK